MTPYAKLVGKGWKKQAAYDNPRLSEMVDMYKELGFEIRLEAFDAANEEGCTSCMELLPDRIKTIYTRKKKQAD